MVDMLKLTLEQIANIEKPTERFGYLPLAHAMEYLMWVLSFTGGITTIVY